VAVVPGRAQADACSGITFNTDTEKLWVQRVTAFTTNLTCAEARFIYRELPGWRDEMPGNVVRTSSAGTLPSPAFEAQGATRWCWVSTTHRYRAPVLPFGDHVLWSVRMYQEWAWNDAQVVGVGPPVITVDTTANGFRWNPGGAPWGQDWWVPTWARIQHHTERNQPMQSWAVHPSIGGVASVGNLWNWKQFNGDWATKNDEGTPGCGDPD
jgi:hypothetical protein